MLLLVREGKMIKVFSCITLTFTGAPPPLRRFLFRSHPLVRFYVWCMPFKATFACFLVNCVTWKNQFPLHYLMFPCLFLHRNSESFLRVTSWALIEQSEVPTKVQVLVQAKLFRAFAEWNLSHHDTSRKLIDLWFIDHSISCVSWQSLA